MEDKITQQKFTFIDNNTGERLVVNIPEKVNPAYGMYVWPCAVVLAQYIWYHRKHLLVKKHVLELGAGTSLPGMTAAKCGSLTSLTLTDDIYQPRSIENCELSCIANSLDFKTIGIASKVKKSEILDGNVVYIMGLSWGEISPHWLKIEAKSESFPPYPDVIIASDCFYDEKLFEKVFFTLRQLFQEKMTRKKTAVCPKFFCTYQVRSNKLFIGDLLHLWGFKCRNIPLSSFNADTYKIAGSNLPGNHDIQMLEISLLND